MNNILGNYYVNTDYLIFLRRELHTYNYVIINNKKTKYIILIVVS